MNQSANTISKVGYIQYSENNTYRLHIVPDGLRKYRLYFLNGKEVIPENQSEIIANNVPFILFSKIVNRAKIDGIKILGMYVPPELRGTSFSDMMLSRFFQMIQESGKEIAVTGQIKKPLLAAKLSKIGFIPERSDIIARIVGTNSQNIPQVVIEENSRGESVSLKSISSTGKNTFYHVVPKSDIPENTGRRVAIQTLYLPPGQLPIQDYIDFHSENIEGKVRIYPERVRKILDSNQKN